MKWTHKVWESDLQEIPKRHLQGDLRVVKTKRSLLLLLFLLLQDEGPEA